MASTSGSRTLLRVGSRTELLQQQSKAKLELMDDDDDTASVRSSQTSSSRSVLSRSNASSYRASSYT